MLAAAAVLVGVLVWAIALPGVGVVRDLAVGIAREPGDAGSALAVPVGIILRTLSSALGIGVIAVLLAWAPARVLAGPGGRRWAAVLAAPMLLPMYLASSAWGQWRAPGTPIGDRLAHLAGEGHRWAPVLTGQAIALIGLALWATPIAACVLAAGLAGADRSLDDARRLEGGGVWARGSHTIGAHRWTMLAGIGAVALVMLGSAVPMHLAQFDTVAIAAWRRLAESGPDAWWRAWIAAWPSVGVAVLAGWVIGGWAVRAARTTRETGAPAATRRTPARGWAVVAAGVFAVAVALPLVSFAYETGGVAQLRAFFVIEGDAIRASGMVAAIVGAIVATLAAATAALLSTSGAVTGGVVRWSARVAIVVGLAPGVLVGAAVARSPIDGPAALIAAHVARFAFVGIALGCWAAAGEPPERRALRRVDGRATLGAWASACLPVQWGAIVGAGLAAAALSLHEIEASVIVQPPGVPSLARDVLSLLHYARTRELAAAGTIVVSIGLVLAVLSGLGVSKGRERAGARHDG